MKINKFKKNKISKFRNTKLYKGIVVGVSTLTLLSALTACKSTDPLDNTSLNDARVITFEDGNKDVAKYISGCDSDDNYGHYRSLVTDEFYTSNNCNESFARIRKYHYNIVKDQNIIQYMTTDEIRKAMNNELTDEEANEIILRIQTITMDSDKKEYIKK